VLGGQPDGPAEDLGLGGEHHDAAVLGEVDEPGQELVAQVGDEAEEGVVEDDRGLRGGHGALEGLGVVSGHRPVTGSPQRGDRGGRSIRHCGGLVDGGLGGGGGHAEPACLLAQRGGDRRRGGDRLPQQLGGPALGQLLHAATQAARHLGDLGLGSVPGQLRSLDRRGQGLDLGAGLGLRSHQGPLDGVDLGPQLLGRGQALEAAGVLTGAGRQLAFEPRHLPAGGVEIGAGLLAAGRGVGDRGGQGLEVRGAAGDLVVELGEAGPALPAGELQLRLLGQPGPGRLVEGDPDRRDADGTQGVGQLGDDGLGDVGVLLEEHVEAVGGIDAEQLDALGAEAVALGPEGDDVGGAGRLPLEGLEAALRRLEALLGRQPVAAARPAP
jgi:hypothetical protein